MRCFSIALFVLGLSAAFSWANTPEEAAHKVYSRYCLGIVQGGDAKGLADEIGARLAALTKMNEAGVIRRMGFPGRYLSVPLEQGHLYFIVGGTDRILNCSVFVFEVEANAFGKAVVAELEQMGFSTVEKAAPNSGMRLVEVTSADGKTKGSVAWSIKYSPSYQDVQFISTLTHQK